MDAQEDNGIPILTYQYHILRDEENTRFAIRPPRLRFGIQQPNDCRDRGYATLTMYQPEDYIHNRANSPGARWLSP